MKLLLLMGLQRELHLLNKMVLQMEKMMLMKAELLLLLARRYKNC
jgi:hypothetical protein